MFSAFYIPLSFIMMAFLRNCPKYEMEKKLVHGILFLTFVLPCLTGVVHHTSQLHLTSIVITKTIVCLLVPVSAIVTHSSITNLYLVTAYQQLILKVSTPDNCVIASHFLLNAKIIFSFACIILISNRS